MIVQVEDDYEDYYVVYKDATPIYSSGKLVSSENYLVAILGEEDWSSVITNKPLSTDLQDTRIVKVWISNFPYYTKQKAIDAISNFKPIWTRKEETEMTLEQICKALGKNIKIIKG